MKERDESRVDGEDVMCQMPIGWRDVMKHFSRWRFRKLGTLWHRYFLYPIVSLLGFHAV